MRRSLVLEGDPLKRWKLFQIGVDCVGRRDDDFAAMTDMIADIHNVVNASCGSLAIPANACHAIRTTV